MYFSVVFSKAILRPTFLILGGILVEIGAQMGPHIDEKSYKKIIGFLLFFNGFFIDFGSHLGSILNPNRRQIVPKQRLETPLKNM